MKVMEIEVFSEASNHAVVKAPGRKFPGIVIQGDSLASLAALAKDLSERLRQLNVQDDEVLSSAQELQEQILERQLHYQGVLAESGIKLPYQKPASKSDLVVLVSGSKDVP
jgi:hypothetical protein